MKRNYSKQRQISDSILLISYPYEVTKKCKGKCILNGLIFLRGTTCMFPFNAILYFYSNTFQLEILYVLNMNLVAVFSSIAPMRRG